jgi:iron complex outermembrane receptor protein
MSGNGAWKGYIAGVHAPHSDYDDYTLGTNLEGGYAINSWNKVKAGLQFRQTSHETFDGGDASMKVLENIWSLGAEYSVNPLKPFTAVAGIGFDAFTPQDYWKAWNGWNSNHTTYDQDWFNDKSDARYLLAWSLGLFYDLTESHELHMSYARKNRFPTILERYSSRFGSTVPNSNLGPEYADHVEFGYNGYFLEKINITSSAYFSGVTDKIASTKVPDPDGSDKKMDKSENLDSVFIYGFEFASEMYLNDFFSVGAALGINKYDIKHSEAEYKYLGNSPELTANGYLVIKPFSGIDTKQIRDIKVVPSFEYVGSRYVSTSKTEPAILTSYTLAHIKVSADITKYFTFSFAVNNLFDELYEISQYFPQAGRSFSLTLSAKY